MQRASRVGWLCIALAVMLVTELLSRVGAPTPSLFGAFSVGIAFALLFPVRLRPPRSLSVLAQALIGVIVGSHVERSTVAAIATHWLIVLVVCVLALAASILSGLLLARVSHIDQSTASFGMIAGGASGVIAMSRDLGADERMVAVLQYIRVLVIVTGTPVAATIVFGATAAPNHPATAAVGGGVRGAALCALLAFAGILLVRATRVASLALLGPIVGAASISLANTGLAPVVPVWVQSAAFAAIGLQVGLRFTSESLGQARRLVPAATVAIVGVIVVSALLGLMLSSVTHVSELDGYLATTPGGLSAVLAFAVGTRANVAFIVSVQLIRTIMMLLAAPPLAHWFVRRGGAARPAGAWSPPT
jgi:uncharacterized protein